MRVSSVGVALRLGVTTVALAVGVQAAAAARRPLSDDDVKLRTQSLSPDLRQQIAALRYRLTPDELADLLSDPRDGLCRAWIEHYWSDRDPICTTPENEARDEYERRVAVALDSFRIPGWPGWDERGEVFIRYGRPTSVGGSSSDVDVLGYSGPQEFWYYASLGMLVRFEDANNSGNYRYVLEDVELPPGDRPRNDRRVNASDKLQDLQMDFMTVESSYYQTPELGSFANVAMGDQFMKMLYNFRAVLETTPSAFSFEAPSCRIPTVTGMLSFRGGDAIDRVDIDTEYAANLARGADTTTTRRFVATAVAWNTSGGEVGRRSQVTTVRTVPGAADTSCTIVSEITLPLRPDFYHVGVTVEEATTHRFTSSRLDLTCWDFERHLAMSDLCLARRIGPARNGSAFNRGALEVVPHPARRYRAGGKVPVYFEVYNLVPDRDGRFRYTVEYSISPLSPRPRGFWKSLVSSGHEDPTTVISRFQFTAAGPYDVVHVLVNTGDLWEGDYRLDVAVDDDVSSSRVSRDATFQLGSR